MKPEPTAEQTAAWETKVTSHIAAVREKLEICRALLAERALVHDRTKLESPEKEHFPVYCEQLANFKYNSVEYHDCLKKLGIGLKHHYMHNSHHPEHYEQGIAGMDLIDLLEMVCDCHVSSIEHGNTPQNSLVENADRFGISPQLVQIMKNTHERILS